MPWTSLRRWLKSVFSKSAKRVERRPLHRRHMVELLEDRLAPAIYTWSGNGGNALWSNSGNWQGNVAPAVANNDDLIFPASANAANLATNNDFNTAQFKSITINGAGFTLAGNEITLGSSAALSGSLIANNVGSTSNIVSLPINMGGAGSNTQTITVSSTGSTLTLSGQIRGITGVRLVKAGQGSLVLSADNSAFTGPITVSTGLLNVRHEKALGSTNSNPLIQNTTIVSGAQLQVDNTLGNLTATGIAESLILNGSGIGTSGAILNVVGNNTWSGPVKMDSDSTYAANINTSLNITGQISDSGSGRQFTKEGYGQVILSSANTYRNRTIVTHGTLTIRDPLALGQGGAGNDTVVSSDILGPGTLQIEETNLARGGFTIADEPLTLNGLGFTPSTLGALNNLAGNNTWASTITLGSANPVGRDTNIGVATGTTLTVTGKVQDPLRPGTNWSKILPGTLIFTNANTYTGLTTVAAGILRIQDSAGLGTTANGTTVNFGASLEYQVDSIPDSILANGTNKLTVSESLTLSGRGVTIAGLDVGALHSVSGINTQTGTVATLGGSIGVDLPAVTSVGDNYLTDDWSLTVTGNVLGSTLTKLATGHLIFPNANSYTGNTTIEAGWLTMRNTNSLGSRVAGRNDINQVRTTVFADASLHLLPLVAGGTIGYFGHLTLAGAGVPTHNNPKVQGTGALVNLGGDNTIGAINTLGGNIILNGPGVGIGVVEPIAPHVFSQLTLMGRLTEVAGTNSGYDKLGDERLIVQGDGYFNGDVNVKAGVLRIQNDTAFGDDSGTTTIFKDAALEIQQTVAQQTGGVVAGIQIGRGEHLVINGPGNNTAAGGAVDPLVVLSGDHLMRGSVTLGSNVTFNIKPNSRLLITGDIDDAGTTEAAGWSDLTVYGTGTLDLSGTNTYSGATRVLDGVLSIRNSQALGYGLGTPASGTYVSNGASLQLQGSIAVGGEYLEVEGTGNTGTTITPRWFEQGPSPILNGDTLGNPANITGKVLSVQVDPTDTNVIYLAAGGGGAWRSVDAGVTWSPMFDDAFNGAANAAVTSQNLFGGSIAVSAVDPRIIVLALGESIANVRSYYGRGVYRSTDSGKTWNQLLTPIGAGGVTSAAFNNPLDRKVIRQVVIDPTDLTSNRIYVAASDNGTQGTTGNSGIWRYTVAQGWYNITGTTPGLSAPINPVSPARQLAGSGLPGPDEDPTFNFQTTGEYSDVFVTRTNFTPFVGDIGGRLFMAIGNFGGSATNTVAWTDNPTSNNPTWNLSDGVVLAGGGGGATAIPNGINTPARNPNNGTIRTAYSFGGSTYGTAYAVITDPVTDSLYEIYKSVGSYTPGAPPVYIPMGQVWTRLTNPAFNVLGNNGTRHSSLVVDPTNANILYLAGINSVIRSADGGLTWSGDLAVDALGNGPQVQIHSISLDTNGGNRLVVATEGGVWRLSATAPFTWTNLNGDLAITNFISVSGSPVDPDTILGGANDNGTVYTTGDPAWAQIRTRNGGYVAIDPQNPLVMYRAQENSNVNNSLSFLQRTLDGGTTWTTISPNGIASNVPFNNNYPGNFFIPFTIDQINPNRLLLGTTTVWETFNQGTTWSSLNGGFGNINYLSPSQYQGAYVVDPGFPAVGDKGSNTYDSDTIYGTDGTSIRVTKNHGQDWVNRTGTVPTNGISEVHVDPRNRDTAFVVRSRFGGQQVYRTTNAGQSWVDITGSLPDIPVRSLEIDARTGDVFIGSDNGVYRLTGENITAGLSTWQRFGAGLPNVQVTSLELNPTLNTLTIGTYGRGAFTLWLDPSQNVSSTKAALVAVSGTPIWTGPINVMGNTTIGAQGTQTVTSDSLSSTLTLLGTIDDPSGVANITKVGKGDVVFEGANTYEGSTTVQEGVLVTRNEQALGNTNGETFVTFGTALEMQTSILGETLHLKGRGIDFNGHRSGALRNTANANTYSGNIFLESDVPASENEIVIGVDSNSELTITGVISDAGLSLNLTKELTGTLILTNANDYDGLTTVNQGALQIQNAFGLGTSAGTAATGTKVLDGAQLQLAGNIFVANEVLSLSGTGIFDTGALLNVSDVNLWAGPVILTTTPGFAPTTVPSNMVAIGVNDGSVLYISGSISESLVAPTTAYGLRKVLPGVLSLLGANSYGDLTLVESGILDAAHPNALGTTAKGTIVSDGATLAIQNGITVTGESLTLNGSGANYLGNLLGAFYSLNGDNTWNGPIDLATTSTIKVDDSSLTIRNGAVPGAVAITGPATSDLHKTGDATLIFAGPNTYDGHTYVDEGILNIRNATALGGGGTQANGTTVADGATLQLQAIPANFNVLTEVLELSGLGSTGTNGALENLAGLNTWTGPITLLDNASIGVTTPAGSLTLPGVIDEASAGLALTKFGPGTAQFTGSASNTYTGITNVVDGTLELNKTGSAEPFGGNLVIGDTIGFAETAVVRNILDNQIPDGATVTIFSDGLYNAASHVEVLGDVTIVDGHIRTGGTGNVSVGPLNMTGGTIVLGNAGATNLTLNGDVIATSSATQTATIQGAGNLNIGASDRGFTVSNGPRASDFLISSPIVGATNIVKSGAGLMEIDAVNPGYTGVTSILEGVLQVDGTLGDILLAGGTLSGNGTVGDITAQPEGTIDPGDIVGTLHSDNVTLSPTSFFHVDLNNVAPGNFDVLIANGNIDLGSATIIGTVAAGINEGDTFVIIQTTGGGTISSTQFVQGASAFIDGKKFTITYTPTQVILTRVRNDATVDIASAPNPSGFNQVVTFTITVTPEPGAGAIPNGSTIVFYETGTAFSTILALTNGQATYITQSLTVGLHTFKADFNATPDFNAYVWPAIRPDYVHEVVKGDSSITIITAPANPTYGEPVTISAQIASVPPGTTLSGTVVFTIDGGTPSAPQPVNLSGIATLPPLTGLTVGQHTIAAVYSGDANFNGVSTGLSVIFTVGKSNVSVAIVPDPVVVQVNQTVTFTVSLTAVAPGAGIPTGFVTLSDGVTPIGSFAVNSFGSVAFPISNLKGGVHSIKAEYVGDTNFFGNTQVISYTVDPGLAAISLQTSVNSSQQGAAVTFTTQVTSAVPSTYAPTGTVTFFVDGTPRVPNVAIDASGYASFTIATLTGGNHTIAVRYNGDSNFSNLDASSAPLETSLIQIVDKGNTTLGLISSVNASAYGQVVVFTASVLPTAPASATATGTVTFTIDGNVQAPSTLNGFGQATFSISSLTPGPHNISAVYDGNGNYNSGSTNTLTQNVNKGAVGVAVGSSLPTSQFGQDVTFTATITPAFGGGVTPTGTATFVNFTTGVTLGTVNLVGNTATITLNNVPVGSQTITATYNGDANYNPASGSTNQVVTIANTTTILASTLASGVYGQPVITATVASVIGGPTPTGTVRFFVNGTPTDRPLVAGVATLGLLNVGVYTITSSYLGDPNYAVSNNGTLNQTITKATPTLDIGTSDDPAAYGSTVTFTATVNPPFGGNFAGFVTFTIDGTPHLPASAVNSLGVATLSLNILTVGTHNITATYASDPNFNDATSGTLTQTITIAPTTTTVASSVSSSVFGQAVTFTASVTPTGGTPTGTVQFIINGTPQLPLVPLNGSSQATFNFASPSVGTFTVSANYSGDVNHSPSSGSLTPNHVVNKGNTNVIVSALPASSVFGQAVNFTANITAAVPAAGIPTGSVTFTIDGTTNIVQPIVSGIATLPLNNLTAGSHSISVSYLGDANFNGNAGSLASNYIVGQAATGTGLVSSQPVAPYGTNLVFTATVAPTPLNPGSTTPTGSVTFFIDNLQVGSAVPVNGAGVATFAISSLTPAAYNVRADYSGDTNYLPSSLATNQTINKAGTTTVVSTTNNPAVFGQPTIQATVATVVPGGPVPTGSVTFTLVKSGITTTAIVPLTAGVATLPTQPAGTYAITAVYSSDSNYNASTTAATLNQVINPAATSTTVSTSGTPSVFGQAVTFTATVTTVAPGAGTPTGTVTFTVNGVAQAPVAVTATVANTAQAVSLSVANLPASATAYVVTAVFNPSPANFSSSSVTLAGGQTVNKASTNIAVTPSANPSIVTQAVTYSATVTAVAPGAGIPTGNVTFFINGVAQTPVALDGSGVATFSTTFNTTGSRTVTANYNGSTNFNTKASGSITQVVNANPIAFFTTPTSVVSKAPFSVVVRYLKPDSTVDTSFSGPITLSLNTSSTGGTFTAVTVQAINGVATFSNLTILKAGAYTFKATATGLPIAISGTVNITAWALVSTTAPTAVTAATAFNLNVYAVDATNQISTNFNGPVTVKLQSSSTGGALSGPLSGNMVAGRLTLTGLRFSKAGTYVLKITSGSLSMTVTYTVSGRFT